MRKDLSRGDTVDVLVHVADGVPPKRHRARVTEVLRQGVRVAFLDPGPHRMGERVVRDTQVELIKSANGKPLGQLKDAVPQDKLSTIVKKLEERKEGAMQMEEKKKTNGSEAEEHYIAEEDYEVIVVSRGEERSSQVTVGSWWAPKKSTRLATKGNEAPRAGDAFRVQELIPKLPMNEVRLARVFQKTLTVSTLMNNWDPVRLKPGRSVRTRTKAPAEKLRRPSRDRIAALEEKVERLMRELGLE